MATRIERSMTLVAAAASVAAGVLGACGDDDAAPSSAAVSAEAPLIDPGDGGEYRPQLAPGSVADVIDNPYLPLLPGARWRYEGEADGEREVIEVVVTDERRTVMGIPALVVRDTVTVDGELVEDTYDWFAQDIEGNVWYLGEDVADYEDGVVVSRAGSWEAGVDGALPGIVMPAAPAVGGVYRQEYLAGEAEDMMEITSIDGTLEVGDRTYTQVVTTRDWTPLEPDVVEEKSYAPGVGLVRERKLAGEDGHAELVEHRPGG
jgi:hypothetical protein